MRTEALVIHLERATTRRPQAERIAAALPMPTTIINAVDAREMGPQIRTAYRRQVHRPRYPFTLRDGEIACFLSHRECWRIMIQRGWPFAVIVEDDVVVDDQRLRPAVEWALEVLEPGDYLRFPVKPERERGPTVHSGDGFRIVEPELPGLGTQMQIVGRAAAERLLAATESFDRPIDSLLQMQWLHGARMLSVHPALIREVSRELGGTVVQNKKVPALEKIAHELLRPFARRAVRRANARWRASTGWGR